MLCGIWRPLVWLWRIVSDPDRLARRPDKSLRPLTCAENSGLEARIDDPLSDAQENSTQSCGSRPENCSSVLRQLSECRLVDTAMLINIVTEMDRWLGQMSSLFVQRFNHLSPQEYCIMLPLIANVNCLDNSRSFSGVIS